MIVLTYGGKDATAKRTPSDGIPNKVGLRCNERSIVLDI